MRSFFLVSFLTKASGNNAPGAFFSISESSLNGAWNDVTGDIVNGLRAFKIPGHKDPLVQIDDLQFESFTIGSASVTVNDGEGVEVSLKDMSNAVAHTHFCAGLPVKCCGELWASATGQSFTGLSQIVVDEATGAGKLTTTAVKGGFSAGDIQIHHQMETAACEAVADGLGLINSVAVGLVTTALQVAFPQIISTVVDTPGNLILGHLENLPAVGLGAEKFQLDNTFVSVDYGNHRLTHYHKGEFKSTVNPKESRQTPPQLAVKGGRDLELGFSDYVFNTLFESLKAEHIGETQIELPISTPSSGVLSKFCSGCPAVVQVKFKNRGQCNFMGGKATNTLGSMKFQVGVKKGVVLPAFTVTVDATADIAFALDQPSGKAPTLKATFSLDSFSQKDVISVIGEINTDDLNRDLNALLGGLLDKINAEVPALPILSLPGTKYENPSFTVDNHQLIVQTDLSHTSAAAEIMV
jgi:hypothetical protein